MADSSPKAPPTPLSKIVNLAGIFSAFLIALPALLKWNAPDPTSIFSAWTAMQFNTAVGLTLSAFALGASVFEFNRASRVVAFSVLSLGALTLAQFLMNIDIGIDEIFTRSLSSVYEGYPGRMAYNTSLGFILIGLATLLIATGEISRRRDKLSVLMSSGCITIGLMTLLGRALGLELAASLYSPGYMPVPTAIGFILVGAIAIGLSLGRIHKHSAQLLMLVPAISSAILTTLVLFAWQYALTLESKNVRQLVQSRSISMSEEVSENLNQVANALSRYAARIELVGTKNSEFVDLDSRNYLDQLPALKRLGFVDRNYKVFLSYPKELHGQIRNFHQDSQPERKQAFEASRLEKRPVLSRSIQLRSGDLGYILPVALFRKGEFQGAIYGTIPASLLFADRLSSDEFQISIQESGTQVFRQLSTKKINPAFTMTQLMSRDFSTWTIHITPTTTFIKAHSSNVPRAVLLIGIILAMLVGVVLDTFFSANQQRLNFLQSETLHLERLEGILESGNVGAWSIEVSTGTVWRSKNHDAIFGLSTPLSTWTRDTFTEIAIAEDRGAALLEFNAAIEAKQGQDVTFRIRLPETKEIRWIRNKPRIACSATGEPIRIFGTVQDVTSEKIQEISNRFDLQWRKAILNSADYSIISMDAEGIIRTFNKASERMLGYMAHEVVGVQSPVIIHDPSEVVARANSLKMELNQPIEPGFETLVVKARTSNQPDENEWTYIRKDGGRVPVSLSVTHLQDETHGTLGYVGIAKDLTLEKLADEQLQLSSVKLEVALREAQFATEAKSRFLAHMSHEIRTPINCVIGLASVLADTPLNPDQQDLMVGLKGNANSLLTLINDILDLSKIESGKIEIEEIEFDMLDFVGEIQKTAEFMAKSKSLLILVNCPTHFSNRFIGDPGRIRQILINFISNAIKFTANGSVTLDVLETQNTSGTHTLRFLVKDSGIGIPAEAQDKVFQPFVQADASTTRKFGGTGLGLSICRRLSNLLGGQVGVESQENIGSTFWFELEIKKGSPMEAHAMHEAATDPNKWKGVRVLVAEDNTFNQIVITRQLQKLGIHTDIANNGNEALAALRSLPYDLVLMDCNMPELDGMEATRQIRQQTNDPKLASIPVVAITANALTESRAMCIAAGMNDFLTKPFTEVALLAMVDRWLKTATKILPAIDFKILQSLEQLQIPDSPDFVVEVIDTFLQQIGVAVPALKTALANRDFQTLTNDLHKLKSTCRTLGALQLGDYCEALERFAKTANKPELEAKMPKLWSLFDHAIVELEQNRSQRMAKAG